MATFSLTSGGLSRTGEFRDPGGSPKDAAVWCGGGNTTGVSHLAKITPRTNLIDYAPDALTIDGSIGWAKPYKAEIPVGAADNFVDVVYMRDLCAYIKVTHPSVARVWLSGFSSGAGLAICCWGSHATVPFDFTGVSVHGSQIHLPELAWDWDAGQHPARPCLFSFGVLDSEELLEHYSRVESIARMRAANGQVSAGTLSPAATTPVCNKSVTGRDAVGGNARTRNLQVQNLGHVFQSCPVGAPTKGSDTHAVELWALAGLGT